jgi:hypothetical protein
MIAHFNKISVAFAALACSAAYAAPISAANSVVEMQAAPTNISIQVLSYHTQASARAVDCSSGTLSRWLRRTGALFFFARELEKADGTPAVWRA